MSTRGLRKCRHCGRWFRPGPRNANHQRFCLAAECRVSSKRASQKKWLQKNVTYFRGEKAVERVQLWRREHPGYWRNQGREGSLPVSDALQEIECEKSPSRRVFSASRNAEDFQNSVPLQDLVLAQKHVLVGFAAMLSGEVLQEDIDRVLTTCYERGQRIGGPDLWKAGMPWMKAKEVSDEGTRTDTAAAEATHSAAVQLGRSPPGS